MAQSQESLSEQCAGLMLRVITTGALRVRDSPERIPAISIETRVASIDLEKVRPKRHATSRIQS